MSRLRRLLAAVAVAAGVAGGAWAPAGAHAALPPVPPARADEAARISATALAGLAAAQRADGLFDDATGRVVGASGLPTLAWAALHAEGDGTDERRVLARRVLGRGSGATVILRWPLAMLAADDPASLPADLRAEVRGRVATWGALQAAGIADRCYRHATCFNNYKLVDAVLNLELARSGIQGDGPNARLRDPEALRRRTEAWLAGALPAAAPATAIVRVPGRPAARAGLLTDPGALPLAYHAMCTAWAVRAVRLLGPDAPAALRGVTRRALWALVGLAAPNGEVAWSGRGQDQLWTLTAAMYAGAAGSAAFAATDPELAARLRRLVDVELAATAGRLQDGVLQVLPSGNAALGGLDHYYSAVGSTGLALTFLELARDELPDPAARRLALPGEVDGATFADPARSGVVARRVGGSWIGVRLRRDHPFDPRQDFGLVRALTLRADGWHEERPARPGPVSRPGRPAQRVPSAGPLLVVGGRALWPRATGWRALPTGVELTGEWRGRTGGRLPARWRITASSRGAALQVACPRGAALALTEWLPRRGSIVRGARFASRAGYRLAVSRPLTLRGLSTRYANARQPSLAAVRVAVACRGGWTTLRWSGGARADG